jgi:four helix bundle protein
MENVYRGYRDLKVYQLSYLLAIEIFHETKRFPAEERYLLIDQMRRSTRSIPANIAEAWKKRRYQKLFVSKLIDCAGEAGEVEVWLDVARDCGYFHLERYQYFQLKYAEISKMLYGMIQQSDKFCY